MAFQRRDANAQEDNQQMSRINSAGLINSTLEKLWNDCYNAMSNGKYHIWNTKLDAIWAILGGDVKEGEKEDQAINSLDEEIYKTGSLSSKTSQGFDSEKNPNNAMQYQLLKKKSLFLRRLQNKQGKGTAYASDDDDDFD